MNSTWCIGDLQGCMDCLALVLKAPELPVDPLQLIFLGDLINRGPSSLETLRWVKESGARTILGNHDLHFLAVAAGIRPASASDTLDELLAAPDLNELVNWLRKQPLAIFEDNHLFVHAGVLPQWDAAQVVALSHEVGAALAGPDWRDFLATMYGNKPSAWRDSLRGPDRLRIVVNALTRLRFCSEDGEMEFATKEGLGATPAGFFPWFDVPDRCTSNVTVVFGHWSTLGFIERPNLLGLDTGCVWGGQLTAVRLADRARYQVSCPQAAVPGPH